MKDKDSLDKFGDLRGRFFSHDWEPPEEDDESQPVYKRKFRELDWIWDKVLPRGGTSIISGAPKVGKTVFITDLGVAHARGDVDFLSRHMEQGIVLFVVLEGSVDEILKRAKKLSKGEHLPIWIRTFISKSIQDGKQKLIKLIEEHSPSLLIIDTLWKLLRAPDVADYAIMAQGVELMDVLAKEYGTHIMAVHHDKKSSRGNISDVLGSTSITGGVDTVIQISRFRRIRRLWSTQRHGIDLEPVNIGFNENREIVIIQGETVLFSDIVETLSHQKEMTSDDIAGIIKARRQDTLYALNDMIQRKVVVRTGKGVRGDPWVYSLPQPLKTGGNPTNINGNRI